MTILYLSDQDLDNGSGVTRKILVQASAWEKAGHRVHLLSMISLAFYTVQGERIGTPRLRMIRQGWKIFPHLIAGAWKLRAVLHSVDFDLVYTRYRLYAPFFVAALKGRPLVVEINSDDQKEYRHSSPLLALYNRIFRPLFLRQAAAFVCVSRELAEPFRSLKVPVAVIANGANAAALPFVPAPDNPRPSLVFIGSAGQPWHGVDKIVLLANKLHDYDFHIVGMDGENGANLFYHGFLPSHEHQQLVAWQDVGIGSLALHRNGMEEASPLKTRQYLAQGLPVVYAYNDTDLYGDEAFGLRLPNTQNNVEAHMQEIEAFVERVFGDSQLRSKIRKFAQTALDVSVKERQRLKFFAELLG